MQLLKTCGIREELANYDNIDLLGFNFIESSKRYITPEKASKIETPFSTLRVGVFGQKDDTGGWGIISKGDLVDIIMTARKAKMNAIQIHGKCDFEYLKKYNYLVFNSSTIDEFRENNNNSNIDFYIIDGKNPGSGKGYDYDEINKLNFDKKFLVAGGVSEKNVRDIYKTFENNENFCGVDIASGVDSGENICLEKVGKIVEKINGINI